MRFTAIQKLLEQTFVTLVALGTALMWLNIFAAVI